eukprot:3921578-Karenia_brevis.AAC.1
MEESFRQVKEFCYFIDKNPMHLRCNGGQGAHAMLRRLYMDNKKFTIRSGESFTLGSWVRAVQQGKTPPKAAEALQMLKDMND